MNWQNSNIEISFGDHQDITTYVDPSYRFVNPNNTNMEQYVDEPYDVMRRSDLSYVADAATNYTDEAIANIDIPEVPSWALQPTKPAYTAAEIGAATPGDVSSAISNTVTPAYIRERMGVRLYVGEDGGIYVHAEEE